MRVYLDGVGCRLNQSELEMIAAALRQTGAELVGAPEKSDLVILNTCAVTGAASADSRSMARRISRRNPQARVILTGCWSTLEPAAASRLAAGGEVVPNDRKHTIVELAWQKQGGPRSREGATAREPIPGARHRVRGFVKVQDGCDEQCTFCVTRIARGRSRSSSPSDVLEQVQQAVQGGTQEVVLCGVQLGGYGRESPGLPDLAGLARLILQETDVHRLRLSSIEPWDVSEGLLRLFENRRVCRHLHLPLQSGCAETVRRMRRPCLPVQYARVTAQARKAIPDLSLTTDLMVGFPGETETEFTACLRFVESMAFAGAHIFRYSARPGTVAAGMPDQVDRVTMSDRSQAMRAIVERSREETLQRAVGRVQEAIWIRGAQVDFKLWQMWGQTDTGFPVTAICRADLTSTIQDVVIRRVERGLLISTMSETPRLP